MHKFGNPDTVQPDPSHMHYITHLLLEIPKAGLVVLGRLVHALVACHRYAVCAIPLLRRRREMDHLEWFRSKSRAQLRGRHFGNG